jgi:hypothetical protein
MTKKADKKPEPADKLFVLGLDGGKPRGARFAERTDRPSTPLSIWA